MTSQNRFSFLRAFYNSPQHLYTTSDNLPFVLTVVPIFFCIYYWNPSLWSIFLHHYRRIFNDPSDYYVSFWVCYGITTVLYWLYAFLLILCEHQRHLKALIQPYKIQPSKHISWSDTCTIAKTVLWNQMVVNIPVGLTFNAIGHYFHMPTGTPLPPISTVLLHLAGFLVVEEIGFYYSHRFLHLPALYKRVHKKHHEFSAPVGYAALYCHPLEQFMSNMAPLFLGPLIFRSHLFVTAVWLILAILNTVNSHCGYHFPGFPSPMNHDFHHKVFNNNFGVLGILDEIHGTNKQFKSFLKLSDEAKDAIMKEKVG